MIENSQSDLTLEPLQEKRKKETLPIATIAEYVTFSMGVEWTMTTVHFGSIVVQRVVNTGSIFFALDYLAKMKMKKYLLRLLNITVKDIIPIKSHGQSVS